MTTLYPYARENHQWSLPGQVSSCTSVACLSLPFPSSPHSQCIHKRHSKPPPLEARAVLHATHKTDNGRSKSKSLISLSPKTLNSEGQTVFPRGHFQRGSWSSRGDDARQPQRAASQQIDRAPIGRSHAPRGVVAFGLVPNEMSQRRAQESTQTLYEEQDCFDGLHLCYLHRQVSTAEYDTDRCRSRSGNDDTRSTLAPTSISKCKGFCTPRKLTLGAASRASVSAPSSTAWHSGSGESGFPVSPASLIGFPFPHASDILPCCLSPCIRTPPASP